MRNYPDFNDIDDENDGDYPECFQQWDAAVRQGLSPGYFEVDDLCDIIDIYLSEGDVKSGRFAIDYAFKIYPDNEELIYEVLLLLNDFELWNDLLIWAEKYQDIRHVWADGHKLTALLHLGMEEDAFHFFKNLKSKYGGDLENISIIYQAMAEALHEIDLYDASIEVIQEAIGILGQEVDLLWLQVQSYLALDDKEKVVELCALIQKKNLMDAETWNRLGNTYKEIDETEKSIESYEFAHSLGFKGSVNLLNMIYGYEKNGNLNKALEKSKEYLSLYPDSYLVTLIAANICSLIENWEEGLVYIQIAIDLEPLMEALHLYKCNFLLKLGETKKAQIALLVGIEKTKDSKGLLKKELDDIMKKDSEA
ncbi:hypothetical protein AwDysgo_13910 [Bacteroidales bacterium]|nr:hypothetical protein AwDysgo_13910 [Bacteroidales bacterium]